MKFQSSQSLPESICLHSGNLTAGSLKTSWWFQPSIWIISPSTGENKRCLKPPPTKKNNRLSPEKQEWGDVATPWIFVEDVRCRDIVGRISFALDSSKYDW